jgi:hypothetical protein
MLNQRLTLDDPATYRIRVQGILSEQWTDYLGGLDIAISKVDPPVTLLEGLVLDQASLIGIINGLYDLGYPLLSVDFESVP